MKTRFIKEKKSHSYNFHSFLFHINYFLKPSLISNNQRTNNINNSNTELQLRKYDSYINKMMNELKYENTKRLPNVSRSVDERSIFQIPETNLPKNPQSFVNHKNVYENEKLKEDLEILLRSSEYKKNFDLRQKSPYKTNEIKGINYNYANKNKRDDVKALLFMDKSYKNPIEKVYETGDNPLKINKKDYMEIISSPNKSFFNLTKTDISNYEILKKKFVNFIHFNIHKDSIDEKLIEKANKIRECEEKKFLMSNIIKDNKTRQKYNVALERRIIISFDEVIWF